MNVSGRKTLDYAFRIHFIRSPNNGMFCNSPEFSVPNPCKTANLIIRSADGRQSITDTDDLVVIGTGYVSGEQAWEAGADCLIALKVALAKLRIGADFGDLQAAGKFTADGLSMLEKQTGKKVLNDRLGVIVYPTDMPISFVSIKSEGVELQNMKMFMTAFHASLEKHRRLTDRELVAYSLFNGSFFQPRSEGRFLLLIMAIEALIQLGPRSPEVLSHVEDLINKTKLAKLPNAERSSLLGSLKWLRKESIGQGGKRLVTERVGNRLYGGLPAPNCFSECYELRSQFVHGNSPKNIHDNIGRFVTPLQQLVSDLLTAPILGVPEESE